MRLKDLIEKRRKAISNKSRMNLTIEIALHHEEENDFKEAFDEYGELLCLAERERDCVMEAKAHRQRGECMLELQSPSAALEHIKMYFKAAKSCGDLFEIQRAYVTIGRCYLDLALTLRAPKEKLNSLNQSEAAFLKSLQMTRQLSQAPSSNESNLDSELAEMRAVSMFNLGLVNREKVFENTYTTAEKYLSQCSTLSINRKLYDMYLRAIMERIDLKFNKGLECLVNKIDKSEAKRYLEEAILLMKSSLKNVANIPFTSNMKKLRNDIHLLEARILLVEGKIVKAAKKYRNLRLKFNSHREYYNERMILCIRLNKKLEFLKGKTVSIKDNTILGQFYEELGLPQIAYTYYRSAMESIKDRSNKDLWKLINKLITINTLCKYYKNNLVLLELKLKQLLREQNKNGFNDRLSSRLSCAIILRMIDCWIRSGTINEQKEKVVAFIEQMDSLSTISESSSVQIKTTKAIVDVYEELSKENVSQYQVKLTLAKEKLARLTSISNSNETDNANNEEEEEEEEFNCLSSSDEFNEPELSSLEQSESEYDHLSSDSDLDHNILTDCQIEELEAVGKRVSSNKNKSFIKRNEKGETMLHVAAIKGSIKQIEHLIYQMKHPVDICDTAGWTPLHEAANHGHIKIVEVLLDNGANIEHTGPPIDKSTPLMEAVNGGSIDTAMLLIERGADLWKKNSSEENIGDCIDSWRQRCRDNNAYNEAEARAYKVITTKIREKLGDRYVEWCRQRKGSATFVKTSESSKKTFLKVKDCRRTMEVAGSEEESEHVSEDENDPVTSYCMAINSLGSKKRPRVKPEDRENTEISDSAGYVVGDDWLENDMAKSTKAVVTEPDYGNFSRTVKKRKTFEIRNENIKASRKIVHENLEEQESSILGTPMSQDEDLFPTQNSSRSPTTITVTYRTIPMVVPLIEGSISCSVKWLIEEVVRRYSHLVPNNPISDVSNVRISRDDGAFLIPDDPLLATLGDGGLKLYAVDIVVPLARPDILFNTQSVLPDQYISLFDSIKSSLNVGHLDLSYRNLSRDLLELLASLHFTQSLPSLRRISLNGNNITDVLLNKSFTNNHGIFNIADFISHHSEVLEQLDLGENLFSGVALSDFLHTIRSKGLHHLKELNLSKNPLGSNDFCVMSLIIKPIIMACSSIEQLRLSNCNISNLSELATSKHLNQESFLLSTNLKFLDLSKNPCLLNHDYVDVMFWKYVENSLEHLSLRGCGALLDDYQCLSMANRKNSFLNDMIATVVDLINNNLSRLHTLDIGDCHLNSETMCQLSRLFTNKHCPLTTLICDDNPSLSESISCWSGLVHNLSQPLCTITNLVIDIPTINSYEDFLTVLDSIQRKIQMRIGRPLSSLDLSVRSDVINLIKDAVLDHENKRLSDEDIEKGFEEFDREQQSIHFSLSFVLSILDFMRDRYKKENVRVLFEGDVVKFRCLG